MVEWRLKKHCEYHKNFLPNKFPKDYANTFRVIFVSWATHIFLVSK